ncbi:MAG: hypothetical protein AAFZ01_02955 [Pseudomonadota bacterium]
MPLKSKFNVVVGCATIVSAVFAGIAIKSDLIFAYKTASEHAHTVLRGPLFDDDTVAVPLQKPDTTRSASLPPKPTSVRKTTRSRGASSSRHRVKLRRAPRRAKRTVNIFAAAKDIPHPNTQR